MPESLVKKFKRWRRNRVFGEGYHWEDLDGPLPASTTGCMTCFGWTDFAKLQQSALGNKCVCCRVVYHGLQSCITSYSLGTAKVRVLRDIDDPYKPQKIDIDLNIAGGYLDYEFYRVPGTWIVLSLTILEYLIHFKRTLEGRSGHG